jgi:ATP-dependent DNA ligase
MKKSDLPETGANTLRSNEQGILDLFDSLRNELSPTKNRAAVVEAMTGLSSEDQEVLLGIVNKKLRGGFSINTINKVVPDAIKVVKIALAKSYDPKDEDKYASKMYCSNKLDGQRVFCVRDHEKWRKYSRAGDYLGNEIKTLGHWDEELEHYHDKTGTNFLDGEAYRHGMEFEDITRLVRSSVNIKDATALEYHIFYAGKTLDLSESSRANSIMGITPTTLFEVFKRYIYLVGVKQKVIPNDEQVIYDKIDEAVAEGYEGVMLRSFDVWYDFKRGNNLLKAKKSKLGGTIEYTDAYCEDIEYGEMVVREDGTEAVENLPVALWVCLPNDDSCKQMKVGSGFSLDQRREWANEEALVVGKTIEVEYQGLGSKGSMRFPRFLRIRSDL